MKLLRKNIYLLFTFSMMLTFNSNTISAQSDFFEDEVSDMMYNESDVYENEEGIDDPTGMYELDEITADTFQQITDIERENALMELQIKQEKLKLDLEKQRAEQVKLETKLLDEERERILKQEEQERLITQEKLKAEEEEVKKEEARKKLEQEEELNNTLLEKINSADLSNPDDINAVAQLMSFVTGKKVSDLGAARIESRKPVEEEEVKEELFEEKYVIKSIIGVAGDLIANLENIDTGRPVKAKKGFNVEGWYVKEIKGSSIVVEKDGQISVIYLN